MNDPATRRVDLHSIDGQPFQPEQARRVGDDTLETLGQIQLIMRTLGQARDLALVTMNCRHSHDHRGHGSPTSTTHQTPLPAQVRRALKGDLGEANYRGNTYARYQYKIPGGGRIWHFVEPSREKKAKIAGRVLIEDAHTAHPNLSLIHI